MPTADEENHAAKKEANAKLDELNDKLDLLSNANTNEAELPAGQSQAERIENLSDELEEEIDKAQEAMNSNRITEADKILRRLRRRIKKVVSDTSLAREMLEQIKATRKAKRRITAAPLADHSANDGR
jgi:ribosomal protein L15